MRCRWDAERKRRIRSHAADLATDDEHVAGAHFAPLLFLNVELEPVPKLRYVKLSQRGNLIPATRRVRRRRRKDEKTKRQRDKARKS